MTEAEPIRVIHEPQRCDIVPCQRLGAVAWRGLIDARWAIIQGTWATFIVCNEHDKFLTERQGEHRAIRIGRSSPALTVGDVVQRLAALPKQHLSIVDDERPEEDFGDGIAKQPKKSYRSVWCDRPVGGHGSDCVPPHD